MSRLVFWIIISIGTWTTLLSQASFDVSAPVESFMGHWHNERFQIHWYVSKDKIIEIDLLSGSAIPPESPAHKFAGPYKRETQYIVDKVHLAGRWIEIIQTGKDGEPTDWAIWLSPDGTHIRVELASTPQYGGSVYNRIDAKQAPTPDDLKQMLEH